MITWNTIAEILSVADQISDRIDDDRIDGEHFFRLAFEPDARRMVYQLVFPMGDHSVHGSTTRPIKVGYNDKVVSFFAKDWDYWEVLFSLRSALSGGPLQIGIRYQPYYQIDPNIPIKASLTLHRSDEVGGVSLGSHLAFPDWTMRADSAEDQSMIDEEGVFIPALVSSVTGFGPGQPLQFAYDISGANVFPYVAVDLAKHRSDFARYFAAVEPNTRFDESMRILSGELYPIDRNNRSVYPYIGFDPTDDVRLPPGW